MQLHAETKMVIGYYCNFFSILLIINGSTTKQLNKVINKLKNNNTPIEDVPEWLESAKVENEPIVVRPLNMTALGVELSMSFLYELLLLYLFNINMV